MKNKAPKPPHKDRPLRGQTRTYAVHKHNPTGSKLLRKFYRAKHGIAATYAEALSWYLNLAELSKTG